MTQVDWGPVNIRYGNSAFFTTEFFDANGNTTNPGGGTFSITYTNINNTSQTDTAILAAVGSFFTCTWSSTNAAPGLAPWTITATGMSTVAQIGVIRVYDP